MTFRLGLVGAGRMGQTHLRALSGVEEVAFAAVAEPVATLRDAVASKFSVPAYGTVEQLLVRGGVDGVVIVTPSDSHIGIIEQVAAAGLPILCEKPCGVSVADTRAARDVARRAAVPLQIAYWRRFVPALVALRDRIAAGHFGDVLAVSCLQWDGTPPSAAFRARSGGIFVDMGVHEFDQARWLVGDDFAELHAVASPRVTDGDTKGDPDSAQVLARMSGGTSLFVSLGRHYPGGDIASVEVFGNRDHHFSVFLDPADGEREQLAALRAQARAFAIYADGGERRGASVDDAIAALEAASAAGEQVRVASE